jgi:hypothetical protein
MPDDPARPLDRRTFLVLGGVTASLAAALVACAAETDEIPVSGEVVRPSTLTQPPVTNAVYLRTSSSVALNAVDSYQQLLDLDVLSEEDAALVSFLREQHQGHADLLQEATVDEGGEAYDQANAAVASTVVQPALEAIDKGGNDPQDVLRYVNAFETYVAATLQGFSPLITVPAPRQLMAGIVGSDNRHAAVVASRIDGFTVLGPQALAAAEAASGSAPLLTGTAVVNTASTTTVAGGGAAPAEPIPPAQVPGAYASLASVEVVLGGQDLTWQTPGPNSYIYE